MGIARADTRLGNYQNAERALSDIESEIGGEMKRLGDHPPALNRDAYLALYGGLAQFQLALKDEYSRNRFPNDWPQSKDCLIPPAPANGAQATDKTCGWRKRMETAGTRYQSVMSQGLRRSMERCANANGPNGKHKVYAVHRIGLDHDCAVRISKRMEA